MTRILSIASERQEARSRRTPSAGSSRGGTARRRRSPARRPTRSRRSTALWRPRPSSSAAGSGTSGRSRSRAAGSSIASSGESRLGDDLVPSDVRHRVRLGSRGTSWTISPSIHPSPAVSPPSEPRVGEELHPEAEPEQRESRGCAPLVERLVEPATAGGSPSPTAERADTGQARSRRPRRERSGSEVTNGLPAALFDGARDRVEIRDAVVDDCDALHGARGARPFSAHRRRRTRPEANPARSNATIEAVFVSLM